MWETRVRRIDQTLEKPNEWVHEREWRVPGKGDPPALAFEYREVAMVVVPSAGEWEGLKELVGPDIARQLAHVEVVAILEPL